MDFVINPNTEFIRTIQKTGSGGLRYDLITVFWKIGEPYVKTQMPGRPSLNHTRDLPRFEIQGLGFRV